MSTVAVDVGTSLVKAVAHDADGAVTGTASRRVEVRRPRPGHAEQDMAETAAAVEQTLAEAAGADPRAVERVAVTAQGDGCWLVGRDGAPVRPAMLWNDGRAHAVVERWQRDGVLDTVYEATGSMGFPGLVNALLAWTAEHDERAVEDAHLALTCGGFVHGALTGRLAMDTSDASAPFLGPGGTRVREDVLEACGLGWARRLVPDPLAEDDRAAPLTDEVAARVGLRAGTPVVMAPYDVPATAIGAGAVEPGQAVVVLGTTLCTAVVVDAADPVTPPATGLRLRSGVPGRDLRVLPTAAGTAVLDWTARLTGLPDAAAVVACAAEAPAGAHGLVFLPYLSPSGERVPFLHAGARGSLHGLSFEHEREHVARAVLEGLVMCVRECLEVAGDGQDAVRLAGGGARSDVWSQLLADALGRPVCRTADDEVGARGAHVAGLVATGATDHAEAVARHVHLGRALVPDRSLGSCYDEVYARHRSTREALVPTWRGGDDA